MNCKNTNFISTFALHIIHITSADFRTFSHPPTINLLSTSDPPNHSNSNSPNLCFDSFCLIKSRVNCSGIMKPYICLKLFGTESLKRIKTKIWIVGIQIFWSFWCREQVTYTLMHFFGFFRSLKPICVITATTQPPKGIYCPGIWNLTLRNDPTNVPFVKGVSKL